MMRSLARWGQTGGSCAAFSPATSHGHVASMSKHHAGRFARAHGILDKPGFHVLDLCASSSRSLLLAARHP